MVLDVENEKVDFLIDSYMRYLFVFFHHLIVVLSLLPVNIFLGDISWKIGIFSDEFIADGMQEEQMSAFLLIECC